MTNKKQKLLSGILVSASTLAVAASVTGLVIGLNKDKSTHPSFLNGKTVNFSAGEGSINKNQPKSTTVESGTTFDRVDQPAVTSNNPKKIFGGWKDQEGNLVRGDATVRKDMNLTATYNDADSSEYVTVLFTTDPSEPGPVLQGNQRISVNKGYYFFMVNRPTAKWTVTTSEGVTKQKYFKGWRYSDGTQVGENDKITSNVTLYPIFNEAVTVTWVADGAHEEGTPTGAGAIERGQETTTLETGATFHDFNQPALKYVYDPTTQTDKAYFAGWYKEKECQTAWDESETLSADATAYAKWAKEPEVGDQYGVIAFDNARDTMVDGTTLPTTLTYGWTPTNSIVVKLNDKTWGDTNKPSVVVYNSGVVTSDYRTGAWEIALGTKSGETITYGDYATLSDSYVFPSGTKYYKIRPVLQYAIDSITVYGDDTVQLESTSQYNVIIEGGSTSAQKVTWSLLTEDGKAFPDGIAKISDSGLVTIASPSRSLWETYGYNCFVVKAQSQLDTSKSNTLKVSLSMPYTDNMYVWIHTESSESANPKWYYADLDAFCDSSATTVTAKSLADDSQHVFDKTVDFTDTITFGTDIYAIPDNFLSGWTNFKGSVDLKNSSVMLIGNEFMAGCTNFNKTLYLSNLTSIGANFLKGCTSYNTAITFNASTPLTWIGEGFMNGCTKFNQTITLPTITSFEIENGFLYNCTSYNKDLTLPSIITYIGDFFMCECKAFTSKIYTSVNMKNFVVSDSSLSSVDSTAAIYTTGFEVGGTEADNFLTYYKTLKGEEHYRTVSKVWTGEVTEEERTAALNKLANSYNFTIGSGTSEVRINASGTNAGGWIAYKPYTSRYVVQDTTNGNIEFTYDSDGSIYTINDSSSALVQTQIDNIHNYALIPTQQTGTWTFSSGSKSYYYSFTISDEYSTSTKYNIYYVFDKTTKDISRVYGYRTPSGSSTQSLPSYTISNVETTAEFTTPTPTHVNTATWNETTSRYEGTDSTAVAYKKNTLFKFDVTEATDVIDAYICTTDETTGIKESFNENYGACAYVVSSTGTVKTINKGFDTTKYKLRLTCADGFAVGDKIYIVFTCRLSTGFEANTKFIAVKPADVVNFDIDTWANISAKCNAVYEGTMTTYDFCKSYYSYQVGITNLLSSFVGIERSITINGQTHVTRIIDTQHDRIVSNSQLALFTIQVVTILSNSSGNALYTQQAQSGTDRDYLNSTLRKNLTGEGTATMTLSQTAWSMLPSDLTSVIQTVSKKVATGSSHTITSYDASIFALTMTEISGGSATTEGTTYAYYIGLSSGNADRRILKDANGNAKDWWTVSPYSTSYIGLSYEVGPTGNCYKNKCSYGGYITFAFCI